MHPTSHTYITLSFIFVKFTLVTDPIAVASNDYAKDCLHKDCCAQAFGRNTLSKPHSSAFEQYTLLARLADTEVQSKPVDEAMVIDKPVKLAAGSSKHPNDMDIVDSELIYWFTHLPPTMVDGSSS